MFLFGTLKLDSLIQKVRAMHKLLIELGHICL